MSRSSNIIRQWLWLLSIYLVVLVAMVLAKPLFMLYQLPTHQFSFSDILSVIWHGLTLDLSTSLYFILFPYLLVLLSPLSSLLSRWRGFAIPDSSLLPPRKNTRSSIILRLYFALASLLMAVAFVVDTSLYEFWGFKLDASVLQFIDGTGHALTSVSVGYVIIRILAILLIALILYLLLTHLAPSHPRTSAPSHLRTLVIKSLSSLLLLPLIIIGLRGGTSVSTTNVGQVYFSQNQFLNHSAVNPIFSFIASFGKSTNDVPDYHFFSTSQLSSLSSHLFHTPRGPLSSLLSPPSLEGICNPRPNILLIIMESCGGQFTELGGNAHVTPNLTRLAHEGIYFTRCYANSWRTDRGMLSIMSGYPALPKTSVMKMPSKVRTLPSIARSLQRAGYSTTFLYGGDANFTNTRGYLLSTGVETIISEDDFTTEQRGSSKWGVCDSITFDRLYDIVGGDLQSPTPRKTFVTFLTLSSHEPWTVPMPTKFQDEKLNAFYYLDHCLGRFIQRFKKTDAWNNTLVIIIPDHGILYKDQDETKEIRSHIPMIWTGGVVKEPKQVDIICNQSDLAATLLAQLGLPHDDFTFSRDIFSPDYTQPFAMHTFPEGFSIVDTTGFYVYDLNSQQQTVGHSPSAIRLGKTVLQLNANDLRAR